ncbi:thiol-activated cytolysin family protein [Maribacter sp. 2307ULW6-5]|uniref:thiol-activated cytolysin family protein n=1 Tax=Maribacter sp. 2307ULW6-5 TaxID=3386275 RepID=UPI0039BCECB3
MKQLRNRYVHFAGMVVVSLPFLLLMACSDSDDPAMDVPEELQKEEPAPVPEPEGLFADVLKLGSLPNVVPTTSTDTLSVNPADPEVARQLYNGNLEEVRYTCSEFVIDKSATKNAFPIWGAPGTVLYPGSFLQGNSIASGTPTAIPAKRSGGSLVLTGADKGILGTVSIPEFNNTQVSLGRSELLDQFNPAPGPFQIAISPVANAAQLALEMGLSEADFEDRFATALAIGQSADVNSFWIALKQDYYGVNYELPLGMEGYFDASVAPSDLAPYISDTNPAVFVSKVGYGRQFYILLQTTTFSGTAEEKIGEAFHSFQESLEGNLQTEILNDLESMSLKVAIRSNNAQGPYEELGEVDLNTLAELLSEPAAIGSAQPLFHEVRSIAQPENMAGHTLEANFNLRLCQLEGALPPDNFRPLLGLFDDGVGAAFMFARGHIVVFNGAGTSYAWLNVTTGAISPIYGIKDTNGLLPVIDAEYVTAAYHRSWDTMGIVDETGNTVEIYRNNRTLSFDPMEFPTESPLNIEFNTSTGERFKIALNSVWFTENASTDIASVLNSGIGAALYLGRAEDVDPTDEFSFSDFHNFYQAELPNRWVELDRRRANSNTVLLWEGIFDLNTLPKDVFPFKAVGAACALELDNRMYQQVYFNGDGTQFFIANANEGLVAGPYLLY